MNEKSANNKIKAADSQLETLTTTKRLDICFLFERSLSDSKLSSTTPAVNDEAVLVSTSADNSRKASCTSTTSTMTSTSCSCSNSIFNSYNGSYERQSISSLSSYEKFNNNNDENENENTPKADSPLKIVSTDDDHHKKATIDSGYSSDVTSSPLHSSDDLIYSLSKLDNPFLLFLCLTLFIENRDYIISKQLDSDDIACYFDKMIRKHNCKHVLNRARYLYTKLYLSKVNAFNYIQQLMHIQNIP